MRVKPHWYDSDKSVIYISVQNNWTWEDAYDVIDTVRLMIFDTHHRDIALLVNMTNVSTHPTDVESHIAHLLDAIPLKIQYVCTASTDPWVHMVYDVITDVYDNLKDSYRAVNTLKDAEAFISAKRGQRIQRASTSVG